MPTWKIRFEYVYFASISELAPASRDFLRRVEFSHFRTYRYLIVSVRRLEIKIRSGVNFNLFHVQRIEC